MDSRENRFVRTEIFPDEDGRGRVLRISPFEQGMAADEIGQILDVMDSFRTTPPPQSVLGDEERLRSYIERSAHKMLSGRRGAGKDAVGVLTRICAQYSSGYGALEHLLRDERVQDIYVDGRDCRGSRRGSFKRPFPSPVACLEAICS